MRECWRYVGRNIDELRRLQTIPGVKERTATSLIAEIGTDMSKFETANHLAAWSGLRPRNDESNRKFKSRRITHGNVYLRKNIIQCAWAASRTKNCFFQQILLPPDASQKEKQDEGHCGRG